MMKRKISLVIYALISCVFAGLSMFTNFFETLKVETLVTPLFTAFGMLLGFAISLVVLSHLAKNVLKAALDAWRN